MRPMLQTDSLLRASELEIAKAWDWHGQSWGGNPDDPEGRSITDPAV